MFGPPVKEPPTDVTPTFLTTGVLSTLRQADFEAHNILRESGRYLAQSHELDYCFKILHTTARGELSHSRVLPPPDLLPVLPHRTLAMPRYSLLLVRVEACL